VSRKDVMRPVNALFLVSAALFVSGIGFVVAAARVQGDSQPVQNTVTLTPVASVKQIMAGITMPAANDVWSAVSTIVDAEGIHEQRPRSDDEWAAVGNSAAALIESANLLMLEGRAVDNGDWMKFSRQLFDTSTRALRAAEAKNTDEILTAGEVINQSCDNCHERYSRE
jgi:hypothetical protein